MLRNKRSSNLKGNKKMPKVKKVKGETTPRIPSFKPLVCGHEGVVHPDDCRVCTKKVPCEMNWLRCGGHGEHIELDCQKLCT